MEQSQHPQCNLESLVMELHRSLPCRFSNPSCSQQSQLPCLSLRYVSKSLFVPCLLGFDHLHHGSEQSCLLVWFPQLKQFCVSSELPRFGLRYCRYQTELAIHPWKPLRNPVPNNLQSQCRISFEQQLEEKYLTHRLSIQLDFPESDRLSHLQLCR